MLVLRRASLLVVIPRKQAEQTLRPVFPWTKLPLIKSDVKQGWHLWSWDWTVGRPQAIVTQATAVPINITFRGKPNRLKCHPKWTHDRFSNACSQMAIKVSPKI